MHCQIITPSRLTSSDRDAMLRLHRRYYDRVRRTVFLADLAQKDWVIILRGADDGLAGFTTLAFRRFPLDAPEAVYLFSGDTVVDQPYRRSPALAGAFGHMILHALERYAPLPCYWLLISKGYRTYRFLPVFFHRFYPACDRPPPPGDPQRLAAVAAQWFGAAYDAAAGIVHSRGLRDRLRPEHAILPAAWRTDPHTRYFIARNPGWRDGDELVCLAGLSRDNLTPAARRVIRVTEVIWDAG